MNTFHKILIKYIMGLGENDQHLRKLFIVANTFAGGLGDWNMLDPVSASILEHLQTMTEEDRVMALRFIHSLKDFRGGDSMTKEEMIQAAIDVMRKLYYEDVEFFYKFVTGYAAKKGTRM